MVVWECKRYHSLYTHSTPFLRPFATQTCLTLPVSQAHRRIAVPQEDIRDRLGHAWPPHLENVFLLWFLILHCVGEDHRIAANSRFTLLSWCVWPIPTCRVMTASSLTGQRQVFVRIGRQLFCVERYPQPPVRRRVESAGKRHASKGMVCVCVCVCVEKNVTPLCVLPHTWALLWNIEGVKVWKTAISRALQITCALLHLWHIVLCGLRSAKAVSRRKAHVWPRCRGEISANTQSSTLVLMSQSRLVKVPFEKGTELIKGEAYDVS